MLPCPTQGIRIRDGKDAWMSELIGEFSGRGVFSDGSVATSGNLMLIDFHLNDSQIVNNACYAGFIGFVELIGKWCLIDGCQFGWILNATHFRSTQCNDYSGVVHHGNSQQRQNNWAIESHTFLCVSLLWHHHPNKRFLGCSIRLPLSPISACQEQRRSWISAQYSARLDRLDLA